MTEQTRPAVQREAEHVANGGVERTLQADLRDQGTREAVTASKPEVTTTSRKVKTPRKRKEQTDCLCGCGARVERRFAIGHDAKLKSRLITTVLDAHATKTEVTKATKQLADLGWTKFLDASRESRAKRAARKVVREQAAAEDASRAEPSKPAKPRRAKESEQAA